MPCSIPDARLDRMVTTSRGHARSEERDYYAVLGVEPSASDQELRTAFREAVLRHHPDLARNSPVATQRTSVLNRAWAALRDPLRRLHYDRDLESGRAETLSWPLEEGEPQAPPRRRVRRAATIPGPSPWHQPQWRNVAGFRVPAEVWFAGPLVQHRWIVEHHIDGADWRERTERYWLRYAAHHYRSRGLTEDWLGALERLIELEPSFDAIVRERPREAYVATGMYLRGTALLQRLAGRYEPGSPQRRWVERELRGHIKRKQGDATAVDALNRVARKVLSGKGLEAPRLGPSECTIQRVSRTPAELQQMERHHGRLTPNADVPGLPTVLAYLGREFVIDGHNRINRHLADGRADPKDVILRLSDFKTNEYANLIGGKAYEPGEENPMIGLRGASTAYDVERALSHFTEEFWSAPHTQVYRECAKLEEAGMLRARSEESGRRRRVYSITAAGKKELQAWLADTSEEAFELRYLAMLKLFFANLGTQEDMVRLARAELKSAQAHLAELEAIG